MNILNQTNYNMRKKKIVTESMIQDLGEQIVNNVYQTLLDYGYENYEIDNIIERDPIELNANNNSYILYCGGETIFEAPGNSLLHKFAPEAEDALLQWCIQKIGKEPDYIDADDLFNDVPGWNNTNESYCKTIKITESELKKVISESVKKILNTIEDTNVGRYRLRKKP